MTYGVISTSNARQLPSRKGLTEIHKNIIEFAMEDSDNYILFEALQHFTSKIPSTDAKTILTVFLQKSKDKILDEKDEEDKPYFTFKTYLEKAVDKRQETTAPTDLLLETPKQSTSVKKKSKPRKLFPPLDLEKVPSPADESLSKKRKKRKSDDGSKDSSESKKAKKY